MGGFISMTKARYVGPFDPDYKFGELYEIIKIKGVSMERAVGAKSIYGDFYAMPAELFVSPEVWPVKQKMFITEQERKCLFACLPETESMVRAGMKEEVLNAIKQKITTLEIDEKQRELKEELQRLYRRLKGQY